MKYHHVGIPTLKSRPNEIYTPELKMYASGYFDNPYRIEWLRFETESPLPEIIKSTPHIAFEVDDMKSMLEGKEIIMHPTDPANGVTIAFVLDNCAPIEFLQFHKPESEVWPVPQGVNSVPRFAGEYHHFGVPTNTPREGEYHIDKLKVHVLDYQTNPYGYEWMRYGVGSPISDIIKSVPHVAFEVDDLEEVLKGKDVLINPSTPSDGVVVAFIVENGAPVEFLQYLK